MAMRAIVAIFDTQNQARDVARGIEQLSDELVAVKSAAIVTRDAKGAMTVSVIEADDDASGMSGGAIVGGLIGLLGGPLGAAAGALVGGGAGVVEDRTRLELDEHFVAEVGAALNPGTTALVAHVDEASIVPIDRLVARHGGRLHRRDLRS